MPTYAFRRILPENKKEKVTIKPKQQGGMNTGLLFE